MMFDREDIIKRIEILKKKKKRELGKLFPTLGLYELLPEDYAKLHFLLEIAEEYCKQIGKPFRLDSPEDLEVLPEPLKHVIVRVLYTGHNKWYNVTFRSSEKLFYSIDLVKRMKERSVNYAEEEELL